VNGHDVIAHGGDTQWFHSYLWLFPQQDVGLYISVNSAGKDGASGPIRTGLFHQFADRYLPGTEPDDNQRVDPETAAKHARMLAGTYVNSRRADSSFLKALGFVGQTSISVDAKGAVLTSAMPDLGGAPRVWIEIAPFVWRDAEGNRMAAEIVDGEVVRLSYDEVSPFMVFEPAPWYIAKSWLLPALMAGLLILLITALSWPAGAIARRRYGAKLELTGHERVAYRLVRGLSALVPLVLIGWAIAIITMMGDLAMLSGGMDWLIVLLQVTSLIGFIGLFLVSFWNLWLVWKGKRGWFSKLWSVLIFMAALVVLWVAIAFNLIGFGLNY